MEQGVFGLIIILFLIFEPDGLAHRWKMIKAYWKLYPFPIDNKKERRIRPETGEAVRRTEGGGQRSNQPRDQGGEAKDEEDDEDRFDGCSAGDGSDRRRISAETIKVGHLADLTGPTGDVGKPYAAGVQAYKNYINSKGGINGKQIEMQMFDYAYDKNKAVNQYKKFKEDKVVAIEGWGTGDTEALTGFINADKIPYISASYSAHLTDAKKTPYNFFCAADYTSALRAGLKYLKEGWKEKRAPKIVFIYPNHPYGIAPIKGARSTRRNSGSSSGRQNVDLKAIEANSQLLSVKNKGADFAWIGGTTNSTAVILKDAKKLGLKTKFFSNIWGIDESTPKLAAARRKAPS